MVTEISNIYKDHYDRFASHVKSSSVEGERGNEMGKGE